MSLMIATLSTLLAEPFFDELRDILVAFKEFARDNEKEIKSEKFCIRSNYSFKLC